MDAKSFIIGVASVPIAIIVGLLLAVFLYGGVMAVAGVVQGIVKYGKKAK